MRIHQLCSLFPSMDPAAFEALKKDIAGNGLQQPIITLDGQILDGAHRYRACAELGIEPYLNKYAGDDPLGFVLSANLHRRHLTESQRSLIAANLTNMRQGERTDIQPSANLPKVAPISQGKAAEMLQVSTRSVTAAAKVCDKGAQELIEAVKSGAVSVSAAAKVAALPKSAQVAAVVENKVKEIASQARKLETAAHKVSNDDALPILPAGPTSRGDESDLLQDYQREVAENAELRERLDALAKDDLKAELDRRVLEVQGLRGRLNQEMTTRSEAEKMAKRRGILIEKIRKALGVERDSEILTAIERRTA